MLTQAPGTFLPAGEPLTVILAGSSDLTVLIDSQLDGSMRNLFLGVGFVSECLGQHKGTPQDADLGDGNGYVNETAVLRWDYGDPTHRWGRARSRERAGTTSATGGRTARMPTAVPSSWLHRNEMPIAQGHNIVVNGYNLGRIGVNHNNTVGIDGENGLIAVLDVKITTTPANATKPSAAGKTAATPTPFHGLIPTLLLILLGALSR
ncbi:hypothetical protein C8R46DRAFT_1200815 [Mycena filopes]|nr:hypothetical protein C8R46DRAFT_1200815 [Mycena filopes]